MSRQIIMQPDGKFAIWSSIVDDFVATDCTPADVVQFFIEDEGREYARRVLETVERTKQILADLREGKPPYGERTYTWQEAVALKEAVHGKQRKADDER